MTDGPSRERFILDRLFEAALAPELWKESLVFLSDYVGGSSVNLIVLDKPGERPVVEHFVRGNDDTYASYIKDYITIDRRVPRIATAPVNTVLLEHQVLDDQERRTDVVYNEILSRNGMRNLALSNLSSGTSFMGMGVAPRDDATPFDSGQVERITRILPHFRHALRFYIANRDLHLHRSALGDLWANSGKGIVILDSDRRVIFTNKWVEGHQRSGLLRIHKGRLRFADHLSEAAWQDRLQRLLGRRGDDFAEFLAQHPTSLSSFAVRLIGAAPVVASLPSLKSPAAIVLFQPLSDTPAIGQAEIDRFCGLFGITPAESRVVAAVAAGRPLEDLAADNGVATDTVRKQLKSAMAKCGVTAQKALVSRLERFCFLSLG